MLVQEGKDKLLEPSAVRSDSIVFEFPITVDLSGSEPNFLGKFAQGCEVVMLIPAHMRGKHTVVEAGRQSFR